MMFSEPFEFRSQSASFHPSSLNSSGVGSFNSNSLARMESKFCKNFVCCSIPLDDLHDLLEHFEQAHCSSLNNSTTNPIHNHHRQDIIVFEDEDEWRESHDEEDEDEEQGRETELDDDSIEDDDHHPHHHHHHHHHHRVVHSDLPRSQQHRRRKPNSVDPAGSTGSSARTRNTMISNLVASFHDSLGIPPALLDGHYRPPHQPIPTTPPPSSSMHPQSKPHHHNLFSNQESRTGSGSQHSIANVIGNGTGSIQDLLRSDDPRSRIKDPIFKKRFAHPDWDQATTSPVSVGSSEEKPFKCSVPGCEKAYKQQNGLKYHKAHGHCSQRGLSAEEELKNFVCHDSVCGKRYKNMNGLRYHYQHTGPHGSIGLELLSIGLHPLPISNPLNRSLVFQSTSSSDSRDSSPGQI